jgi:hypothetical protein
MLCVRASRSSAVLIGVVVVLTLAGSALAQEDPCAENGPDCRLLTPAEIAAIKSRLLALKAAMPVPDTARWAPSSDAGMAFTMSFIAELEAGAPMISGSWPGGAFTERKDVHLLYDGLGKPEAKPADPNDPLAAIQRMQAAIGNRIEVLAELLPHAYLVHRIAGQLVEINDSEPTDVEKTPAFLTWMSGEGTNLTMIFGPRTSTEAETLRVDKPAASLAPVKCITLKITGPSRAEVLALKKKIDRKAFEALLGPIRS